MTLTKEEKEETLKMIFEEITPDDVVAGILSYLPKKLTTKSEKWQKAFKKLKEKEEYKDLLEDFRFVDRSPFPRSSLLERLLNSLPQERLLSTQNPEFKQYELKDSQREVLKEVRNKFGEDERRKLENMASEIEDDLFV